MRILVVGSGGREHALVWALSSGGRNEVSAAPGNPGTAMHGKNYPVPVDDLEGLTSLASSLQADLVVVGPEVPLVAGLGDLLRSRGIPCFGPDRSASRLEGSKWFAKEVMSAAGVPTARGAVFTDQDSALELIDGRPERFVIKADGLAAGKGVFLPGSMMETERVLSELFQGSPGESGCSVVVEERLQGREVSILAICSGTESIILPPSRDHKRLGEGDTGPNTGGMGAVCPPPGLPDGFGESIRELVIGPVLEELAARGMDYRGVLYAGLILTDEGPKVLEFNVRFGDPETQAVLPMIDGDLGAVMLAAALGESLPGELISTVRGACSSVVMVSGGYPGSYRRGLPITGAGEIPGSIVFHAGTKMEGGSLVTSGGRVLAVSALGGTLEESLKRVYGRVAGIDFPDASYRKDIGRTN